MYAALPKNIYGNADHASARYALHRIFVKRHGWTISGLEPSSASAENTKKTPLEALSRWMPTYLMGAIEKILGTRGVDLRELAILAATFEDLIHKEAAGRLKDIYEMLDLDMTAWIEEEKSEEVMSLYMSLYTSGGNESVLTVDSLRSRARPPDKRTLAWMKRVRRDVAEAESVCDAKTGQCGLLDFAGVTRVVEEITEQYGPFNEALCREIKTALMTVEEMRSGRVRLKDFYSGVHGAFAFMETSGYLRDLGVMDDTIGDPRVIIVNYVGSRPNCLAASAIYMVCCRNPCEDILEVLEKEAAAPTAPVAHIVEIIESLPAHTLYSKGLPLTMRAQLQSIANSNGGEVSLHGRSFAQWMHKAFPLECPRPHKGASSLGPQTPDEWEKGAPETVTVSDDELNTVDIRKAAQDAAKDAQEDARLRSTLFKRQ